MASPGSPGDASAFARPLDITIIEAQLVRIFDSLKPNQDVFVQLVCGYDNGTEKVVGRTEICKNGNLFPRWNERFLCGRDAGRGSKTLKLKVFIDHLWRSPVLCGEAEFGLDSLWSGALAGPHKVTVPLYKKGECTGVLVMVLALQGQPSDSVTVERPVTASSSTHADGRSPAYYVPPAAAPYALGAGSQQALAPVAQHLGFQEALQGRVPELARGHSMQNVPPGPMGIVPPRRPSEARRPEEEPARGPWTPQLQRSGVHQAPVQYQIGHQPAVEHRPAPPIADAHQYRPAPPKMVPEAARPLQVPAAAAPPSSGGSSAIGMSGQWWNSFIDRG